MKKPLAAVEVAAQVGTATCPRCAPPARSAITAAPPSPAANATSTIDLGADHREQRDLGEHPDLAQLRRDLVGPCARRFSKITAPRPMTAISAAKGTHPALSCSSRTSSTETPTITSTRLVARGIEAPEHARTEPSPTAMPTAPPSTIEIGIPARLQARLDLVPGDGADEHAVDDDHEHIVDRRGGQHHRRDRLRGAHAALDEADHHRHHHRRRYRRRAPRRGSPSARLGEPEQPRARAR